MARRIAGRISARNVIAAAALAATAVSLSACAAFEGRDSAQIYRRHSDFMSMSGRFRQETNPADAPYTSADLIRDFELVAFEPETQLKRFYPEGGALRRLSKWRQPVRYSLIGDGVTPADRDSMAETAALLARHSGHEIRAVDAVTTAQAQEKIQESVQESAGDSTGAPISAADIKTATINKPQATDRAKPGDAALAEPNLAIYVFTAAMRRRAADEMKRVRDRYESSLFKDWVETLNVPCFAQIYYTDGRGGEIVGGEIYVKAELENPLRGACFVEEFTQSLGLVFDHDEVRPSIFNDDQEFIALTKHDLELVEILYDPQFEPGMSRAESLPILRSVVAARAVSP